MRKHKIDIYMADSNTTNFAGSGDGIGSGNTKELVYMTYILNCLNDARKSFDTKDIERFNLYMSFLKASILDKNTRDSIEKEMKIEEKRLKAEGMSETFIEFNIGFVIVREIMGYINETLELSHDDIIGEIGRLDCEVDEDEDEDDDIVVPNEGNIHINPEVKYQSYPTFKSNTPKVGGV